MRTKLLLHTIAALLAAALTTTGRAEEKNGLLVSVGKKTIDRNDAKGAYIGRTDRTQGLALSVKNTSIRDFPAGEVQWTIVVRKTYEGGLYKYTGKEALKALRPSSTAELVLGAAQTTGYRSETYNYKDKLEYEVVIVHDGKETLRTSSDPNFAVLAKRATSTAREVAAEDPSPRRPDAAPTDKPMPPKGDFPPKPGVLPKGDLPPKPGDTPVAKPVEPKPGDLRPADPKPAEPKPTDTADAKPADNPPADAPAGKPFDFFNLDKKKPQPK
jgi:hypothetical protein